MVDTFEYIPEWIKVGAECKCFWENFWHLGTIVSTPEENDRGVVINLDNGPILSVPVYMTERDQSEWDKLLIPIEHKIEKAYFTADTHFCHDNIIQFCNRPFKDVDEMNEYLINMWNSIVPPGGLVYHLGDLGWRKYSHILDRLNGQIYLIKGSHDWHKDVNHKKIIKIVPLLDTIIENQRITMCHYAMRNWHLSHYNTWHLYGHSHGRLEPIGKSWDVGVDANNMKILTWSEIKQIMANRPDNPNLVDRAKEKNNAIK